MHCWILYDIRNNRARKRISDCCLRLGLRRVQKSVFVGELPKNLLRSFESEVLQWLNLRTDRLFLLPTAADLLLAAKCWGQKIDLSPQAGSYARFF